MFKVFESNQETDITNSLKIELKQFVATATGVSKAMVYRIIKDTNNRENNAAGNEDEEDFNFVGSRESLRNIFKKLGFRLTTTQNNWKLLEEKPEIRNQKHPIFYVDETYTQRTYPIKKLDVDCFATFQRVCA
ncbi:hypothetical protein ILUMI_25253 [Ignelater luminosus]|uniref:Uncharacterized protein n=1 Tax=Ignelater luminosus TaxID=2038154 RepID=A0A8K0C7P6_IGNLU|nr:hypothetical protein ILUMI_25253 [Ignelater luminosus]